MSKLVIMAGGTGGHVFPGLAVAKLMRKQGWQVEWMGTANKMEADIVPKHGYPIHFIDIGGLRGKGLLTKLKTPFTLLKAFFQARRAFKQIKPNAVLGMGGYASGPGGLAAYSLGIPIVIHEQNAVFGMTNKYLSKLARYTLTGFDLSAGMQVENAKRHLHFVGNPIRDGFFEIQDKQSSSIATSGPPTNVLIVGGSLGALALNQRVPLVIKTLMQKFDLAVKHQSGKGKQIEVLEAYSAIPNCEVLTFIDDMEAAFAWADIIICRAGALTVAEVAGAGRAAIFVPLPIAVDDHQTANAKSLSDKEAGILLPQADIEEQLEAHLITLCSDPQKRIEMAKRAHQLAPKHATQKVANFIQKASMLASNNQDSQ